MAQGLPNRPPVKDKGTVSTFIEDYPTGFLEVAKQHQDIAMYWVLIQTPISAVEYRSKNKNLSYE